MNINNKRLGMGLEALFGENNNNTNNPKQAKPEPVNLSEQDRNGVIDFVKLANINFNPNQPRSNFDQGKLEELSQSIVEHGVLQPILLQRSADGYTVVAGERRCRAANMANIKEIPAIILRGKNEKKLFEVSILENIQRDNLSIVEEAKAYNVLINKFSSTHEEIADSVGKSRSHISNCLRILKMPIEVIAELEIGNISYGHAKVIAGQSNPIQWMMRIKDEDLSVKALNNEIKKTQSPSVNQAEKMKAVKNKITEDFIIPDIENLNTSYIDQNEKPAIDMDLINISNQLSEKQGISVQIDNDEMSNNIFIMIKCPNHSKAKEILNKINNEPNN